MVFQESLGKHPYLDSSSSPERDYSEGSTDGILMSSEFEHTRETDT